MIIGFNYSAETDAFSAVIDRAMETRDCNRSELARAWMVKNESRLRMWHQRQPNSKGVSSPTFNELVFLRVTGKLSQAELLDILSVLAGGQAIVLAPPSAADGLVLPADLLKQASRLVCQCAEVLTAMVADGFDSRSLAVPQRDSLLQLITIVGASFESLKQSTSRVATRR